MDEFFHHGWIRKYEGCLQGDLNRGNKEGKIAVEYL